MVLIMRSTISLEMFEHIRYYPLTECYINRTYYIHDAKPILCSNCMSNSINEDGCKICGSEQLIYHCINHDCDYVYDQKSSKPFEYYCDHWYDATQDSSFYDYNCMKENKSNLHTEFKNEYRELLAKTLAEYTLKDIAKKIVLYMI